ncbi:UPAR/Ly6 domain-containing protein bou-like [Tachypleus tridentatus]|uniref:UPAR/Ly6 domain-containing protein bou-like n=1 Tax=Tachypleus tridentatus TaxID=6853 RepID=UPI003FD2D41D
MHGGEIGTKRYCSSRDLGNFCEYIRRLGDDREYRSCVYTCSADNCNTANSWTSWNFRPTLFLLVFLMVYIIYGHDKR